MGEQLFHVQANTQSQRCDRRPGARAHAKALAPCRSGSCMGVIPGKLGKRRGKTASWWETAGRGPAWTGAPSKGDSPGPASAVRTARQQGRDEAGGAPIRDRFWSMMKYSRPRMGYASVWSARPGQRALGARHCTGGRGSARSLANARSLDSLQHRRHERRASGGARLPSDPAAPALGAAARRPPARGTKRGRRPLRQQAAGAAGRAGARAHWTRRPRCRPSRRPRRSGPTRRPGRPCRSAPGPAAGSCRPRWRPPPAPGPRSSPSPAPRTYPARRRSARRTLP
jgi:hypothetical protein